MSLQLKCSLVKTQTFLSINFDKYCLKFIISSQFSQCVSSFLYHFVLLLLLLWLRTVFSNKLRLCFEMQNCIFIYFKVLAHTVKLNTSLSINLFHGLWTSTSTLRLCRPSSTNKHLMKFRLILEWMLTLFSYKPSYLSDNENYAE